MLSLCLGQAENRLALGAFPIDVRLAIPKTVADQLEEAAEFFVFLTALLYVPREDAVEDHEDQQSAQHQIGEHQNGIHAAGRLAKMIFE